MNQALSILFGKKGRRWIAFGILAALLVIFFISYSQQQFKNSLTRIFHAEQSYNATLIQNLIKEHLDEAAQNLRHVGDMIALSDNDPASATSILKMMRRAHGDDFSSISLIDSDGRLLAAADLHYDLVNFFDYVEIEQSGDTGDIFLSERFLSDNDQPVLFMFVPFVPDSDRDELYYTVGELNLKIFVNRQLDVIRGERISFVVADFIGDIFTIVNREHQDFPEMERGNIFKLDPECLGCHRADSFDDIREAVESGAITHSLFEAPDGKIMNRTATTLEILNEKWVVSISQPYDTLQGQINRYFYSNIGAGAILLVSIFLGVFIAYRRRNKHLLEIQYRSLINNINVGIFRADAGGLILEMNEALRSLLGLTDKKDTGNLTVVSLLRDPEDWHKILASFNTKDTSTEADYLVKRKDRDDFVALFLLRAARDSEGQIIYIEGVIQDITDLKRAEKERVKISRLESIELLAGGIAHDFNNQLTAIVGNISLSRMETDPKKQKEFLRNAEKASFRAQGLTRQLLTFARGGAPVKAPDSVEPLIRECADFILRGSNCKVEYRFDPDLNLAEIDSEQITQVIQNLVINASQAMPGGGVITITGTNETVVNRPPLAKGDYVRIRVQDQGSGISPDIIDHIFDPYFTTKETGTGLGLAVSYSVVKKHGGLIFVESTPGVGTQFTLYLPAAAHEKTGAHDPAQNTIMHGSGRVLIIDDDTSVGQTLVSFLREIGYTPIFVNSGRDAVKLFEKESKTIDLVITDLTLPGDLGGLDIKERIRRVAPDMKIIVASGYANDPVLSRFREYGFDGIIRKPFTIATVATVLHKVLRPEAPGP